MALIVLSLICHSRCLVTAILPHMQVTSSAIWPLEGVLRPSSYWHSSGEFSVSSHTNAQTASWVMDNFSSLTLSGNSGIFGLWPVFPASFYSSHNYGPVFPVTENLLCLIPSWARPVRVLTLILPTGKHKNPVKHRMPVMLQHESKTEHLRSVPSL